MGVNDSKNSIIERLKTFYGFKTNNELAKMLGIAPNTISGWIKRNSIDYDLIFSHCPDIDFNWLITGVGQKNEPINPNDIQEGNSIFSKFEQVKINQVGAEFSLIDYLIKRLSLEPIDDVAIMNISTSNLIVSKYYIYDSFSKIYEEYKDNKDIDKLCASFLRLYKDNKMLSSLLKPYKQVIDEITSILLDFEQERDPIKILDELG